MKESKSESTDRLRREGRWDDARKLLDQTREQHLSQGKSRQEANKFAWEAVRSEFPPHSPEDERIAALSAAELKALVDRSERSNLDTDRLWVYHNLSNPSAQPNDAPGLGAWSMLQWARNNSNQFFAALMPRRALKPKESEQNESQAEPKEDPTTVMIRELLAEERGE